MKIAGGMLTKVPGLVTALEVAEQSDQDDERDRHSEQQ
jgi:hypothetical protein